MRTLLSLALCICGIPTVQAQDWTGEWVTDLGPMSLKQSGTRVTGGYAKSGTITGMATGSKLTLDYSNGNSSGKAEFAASSDGKSFTGTWSAQGNSGAWRGWRKDPDAESADLADFSGVWLSSVGTMQLEQTGDKVTGRYGAQGWSTLEGQVVGRRLQLNWKRIRWSGSAWIEQTPDGKRIFGLTEGDDPSAWIGIRLEGFEHHAPPSAGEIVEGRADNGMLYFLRMPDQWTPGEKTDVVVLLHGSNWTTKGMVYITAQNWPDIGNRFAILGIQGEQWAKWSDLDDLRFNYTYVNWMGRSTYQGYPYTDKESPYLVMQVIDELKQQFAFDRVFVGGHSQGGYLTYALHMHFPEKLAGTFPMAGGLIIQAEPDVFDDESLMSAQRQTPMAIVHGQRDQVVAYSMGQYNYNRFLAHDFPLVKFINPNSGHPYDFLPVGDAITWLDVLTTTDTSRLAAFANEQASQGAWRGVGAALAQAKRIGGGAEFADAWQKLEDAAAKDASRFKREIQTGLDSRWIDEFLDWQEQFALADAAQETLVEFSTLQSQHDERAKELKTQARTAFSQGNREEGYAKYEEIVDKYFASREYRTTKSTLDNRRNR